MKTIYIFFSLLVLVIIQSSCLRANLDELDTYDLNEITNVRFEYRWWDENLKKLRVQEMEVEKDIDSEKREINCSIIVPQPNQNFTSSIRKDVSINKLAINVDISTAARIYPEGNSPVMGVFPSDFSDRKFSYKVVAGNGNIVTWVINIVDFKK